MKKARMPKHSITMRIKITRLTELVMRRNKLGFRDSLRFIYNSRLFAGLEDEETKIWHYSEELLCDLLTQEKTKGRIEYPDV